jgi:hypothetical protein
VQEFNLDLVILNNQRLLVLPVLHVWLDILDQAASVSDKLLLIPEENGGRLLAVLTCNATVYSVEFFILVVDLDGGMYLCLFLTVLYEHYI